MRRNIKLSGVSLFYFAVFFCSSVPAIAEVHNENPGTSKSGPTDVFSSVGKPGEGAYRGEPTHCHIICGPNKENYWLDYLCDAKEGVIYRNQTRLKTFQICRTAGDIVCGNEANGFTIRPPSYTVARAQYKSDLLGGFFCHNE